MNLAKIFLILNSVLFLSFLFLAKAKGQNSVFHNTIFELSQDIATKVDISSNTVVFVDSLNQFATNFSIENIKYATLLNQFSFTNRAPIFDYWLHFSIKSNLKQKTLSGILKFTVLDKIELFQSINEELISLGKAGLLILLLTDAPVWYAYWEIPIILLLD